MNAREEELTARALLADPAQVDVHLQQKRWATLAALVRFARRDVPVQLAQTDPALYRLLREQITRLFKQMGFEEVEFRSEQWSDTLPPS